MKTTGSLDAIILAGGRAERLGGASKPDLVVGGRTLLSLAIGAARAAGCDRIVVVGPADLDAPGCTVVRENPPFGGPVAAIAAGLEAVPAEGGDVLVLACDMPEVDDAVRRLREARGEGDVVDGVCLVDADGHVQWLSAIYDRAALERGLGELGSGPGAAGASMRRLAASLDLAFVADGGSTRDIDTWSDLERARSTGQEAAP